jgi:hypothetical protein
MPEDDLSFLHLQAELARLDILIQRQVARWQLSGQDPHDAFRGLYISDQEAGALLDRGFGANWGGTVQLPGEQEALIERALQSAQEYSHKILAQAGEQGHKARLLKLAEFFNLSDFDLNILLVCLAPALDLRYERLYGYLQDDVTRKRPSVNLALDLLCPPGPERLLQLAHFDSQATLFRYRLLEKTPGPGGDKSPLLSQVLSVDESVVSWLLGRYQPHPELLPFSNLQPAQRSAFAELLTEQLQSVQDLSGAEPPILVLYGRDQAGQDAAAHHIASETGQDLLVVSLDRLEGIEPNSRMDAASVEQTLRLALRDARMVGAVPYLRGWDICLQDGVPPAGLLAELCAFPGMVILSSSSAWRAAGIDRQRPISWLEFGIPIYAERRQIWKHYLGQSGVGEDEADLTALAGQFQLTIGQIRDAVTAARDWALQAGEPVNNAGLFAAARLYSNPRLSSLARKLQPRYGWDDIVLPNDQRNLLFEIVNTVRQRPRVLDEWGVGRKLASSRGVTVLFAGPPGTGKTMGAEVIAGELGLDLYKIDLSTVVSKYIGETEKNLERIFNEAESSNAILFFDEADSLFGKRSEVRDSHDRYANIEISYLLQRMEAYDGVTILATNLRANLDEAFTRRLQFAVDFPFPEEADRLRIWRTLFPAEVPCSPDVDLSVLARRFKIAGGNIRNIIVNAAFLAASDGGLVSMSHLLHGTRRELQKMGRLVSEGDMILE